MKAYTLIIATLLCAGLCFSFTGKENLKVNETQVENLSIELVTDKNDPDATNNGGPQVDPISNYPDPFTRTTTIEFTVYHPTKVSLIVYYETGERVAVLLGQWMHEGHYRVVFDSREGRVGKYYAYLQMGGALAIEEMTKVYTIHSGLPVWY